MSGRLCRLTYWPALAWLIRCQILRCLADRGNG